MVQMVCQYRQMDKHELVQHTAAYLQAPQLWPVHVLQIVVFEQLCSEMKRSLFQPTHIFPIRLGFFQSTHEMCHNIIHTLTISDRTELDTERVEDIPKPILHVNLIRRYTQRQIIGRHIQRFALILSPKSRQISHNGISLGPGSSLVWRQGSKRAHDITIDDRRPLPILALLQHLWIGRNLNVMFPVAAATTMMMVATTALAMLIQMHMNTIFIILTHHFIHQSSPKDATRHTSTKTLTTPHRVLHNLIQHPIARKTPQCIRIHTHDIAYILQFEIRYNVQQHIARLPQRRLVR
mmetsp:Transcript_10783/g.16022  ORF Transcript_10783/g.16022 Transcript_10783/m.16022 type:complete len:294 (-) Transcript_10783:431-1312(-)